MPRQRTYYSRRNYDIPDGFPERLKRFPRESGLSWSDIARRLGTYRHDDLSLLTPRAKPLQH